jgi:hypothetical protein
MVQRDEHYSLDERGLLVENVGPWATDKLKIVTDYIQASGAVRRRYLGSGAAYIDVFCGPSRSRIRTTGLFIGRQSRGGVQESQRLAGAIYLNQYLGRRSRIVGNNRKAVVGPRCTVSGHSRSGKFGDAENRTSPE